MDVLIFDMDGVLIDVSKSYRKTIQRTIQIYLETCLGFERSRTGWITDEEISLFKSAGGFNNDWDLTSGLFLYLLSILGIPPLPKRKRFSSVQAYVKSLDVLLLWQVACLEQGRVAHTSLSALSSNCILRSSPVILVCLT